VKSKIHNLLDAPALPIVLGLTAILRILYWYLVANEPWFETPGMDPEFYQAWARAILTGHGSEYIPFPRAPLYPYLLAGMFGLFGEGWVIPRLFNLFCDLGTVLIVWHLTRRRGSLRTALIASLLFAFCGMAIYQSGELLMTSLETCLASMFLFSIVRTIDTNRKMWATITGAILALLALCRPNALILIPLFFALPMFIRQDWRIWLPNSIMSLLTVILCLAPVTYFNYAATGNIIPVATQGGVNFFIGNARGSNGWSSSLPGVGIDWVEVDAERIAEADAGRKLNSYEESAQFVAMGVREIKADPKGWLELMVRKILLLVNIREIGNNRPLTLPKEALPPLELLFLVSFGFMLPFAALGWLGLRKDPALRNATLGYLALFGGSLLLFFISSRYRLPLLPGMVILSGFGIDMLITKTVMMRKPMTIVILLIGILLAIPPWAGSTFDDEVQGYFVTGNALMKQSRHAEAALYYARASSITANYPRLHLNNGVNFLALGDTSKAIGEFEVEFSRYPERGEALNNLAVVAEARKEWDLARNYYLRASKMQIGGYDATLNLFRLTLSIGDAKFQTGELDSAEYEYRNGLELLPNDPKPYYRLALLSATRGNIPQAREFAEAALLRDPDYLIARRLLEQLPTTE